MLEKIDDKVSVACCLSQAAPAVTDEVLSVVRLEFPQKLDSHSLDGRSNPVCMTKQPEPHLKSQRKHVATITVRVCANHVRNAANRIIQKLIWEVRFLKRA